MKTKNDYIAEARQDNPKPMFYDANGVKIELSDDEYEAAIEAWATMRVQQDAAKSEADAKLATKRSAYAKLGLTDDEINAILS